MRWLWTALVMAILFGAGTFFVRNTWWDVDDVATLQASVDAGVGFDGTDEYDPVGDDHYNLPPKAPQVRILLNQASSAIPLGTRVSVERWTAEEKLVSVDCTEPTQLALHLLNYPAWRVEVNGTGVNPEPPADSNQMILTVPAGHSLIRIHFQRTWDRLVGLFLSTLSASTILALVLLGRRQRLS
jgi:hypothetical protein